MITDIDGNNYKTVKIGKQKWMSENLNVSHYRNGDVIPEVKDAKEWEKLTTGAWCYYENDTENGKIYGKLYNWFAVNDPRGLAPEGWHIPTDAEWMELTEYIGGREIRAKTEEGILYWIIEDVGGKLKAKEKWKIPLDIFDDFFHTDTTNETGFTAIPGGCRYHNGIFVSIEKDCDFWSATASDFNLAWGRELTYFNSDVQRFSYNFKYFGFSIRCVRD